MTVHAVVANIGDRAAKRWCSCTPSACRNRRSIVPISGWLVLDSDARAREQRRLSLHMPWRRLAHWSEGWQIEPGTYRLTSNLASDLPGATALVCVFTGEE